MEDALRRDTPYRVSETVTEGAELFRAAVKMGLEGIMAKGKKQYLSARHAQRTVAEDKETADYGVRDHRVYKRKGRP